MQFMHKIFIATFSHTENGKRTSLNGMIEPLLSFFLPKGYEIDMIDGFHPGSSDVISLLERYKGKKLEKSFSLFISKIMSPILWTQNSNGTRISFKIRDFFSVIEWGIRSCTKYDLFIGLESIYTLGGIILKKFGIVKKVVYYVSDYSPNRYGYKLINTVYTLLDRICAENADFIWDVSPAIQLGRIQGGLNEKKSAPVIIVPNALFPEQIIHTPNSKRIPHSLVFAGTLGKENGPDLAISAMRSVLTKYPKAQLHIFGGNKKQEESLKELVKNYNLENSVFFYGFKANSSDLSSAISRYTIGLAPYRKFKDSVREYGDATKLRLYMGVGIPALTTNVPPLGKALAKQGAALIVKDTVEAVAKGIIKLLEKKNYTAMQDAAISFGEKNTWENSYSNAFKEMNITD